MSRNKQRKTFGAMADDWIINNECEPTVAVIHCLDDRFHWTLNKKLKGDSVLSSDEIPKIVFRLLPGVTFNVWPITKRYATRELAFEALRSALVFYQFQGHTIGGTNRHLKTRPELP